MEGKEHTTHCACRETNSVEHSLIYKPGSYTSMGHKSVRDSKAQIMRIAFGDVQREPTLLPINENEFERRQCLFCHQDASGNRLGKN